MVLFAQNCIVDWVISVVNAQQDKAGVKGEAKGHKLLSKVYLRKGDWLTSLHMAVANHHVPITYKEWGGDW